MVIEKMNIVKMVMGEVQKRGRGKEWLMKEREYCVDSDGEVRGC